MIPIALGMTPWILYLVYCFFSDFICVISVGKESQKKFMQRKYMLLSGYCVIV